jgi:glycerol-3-phosphate acyltransferase PlsY
MYTQLVLIIIALGYIIGSFPTAYLIGRLNGVNIFELGSGNMGTTNVLRTLGTFWAILVGIGDFAKGIIAVWLGRELAAANPELMSQASASVISAVAVVVGHNWSFFASLLTGKIRGGKGAATAGGTWLIMMPAVVIALPLAIMALIVITTRYMSLGVLMSVVTAGVIIGVMLLTQQLEPVYILYYLVGVVVFYRHRENIQRLLQGNERRVGEKVQTQQ